MPGFDNDVCNASLLTLDGSGAGAQNVIDITPDTAIGGIAWRGIDIDGSALDPTGANATAYGIAMDFSGVSLANDPEVIGIDVTMPIAFAGDVEKAAGYFRGFGLEVELCSGDHEASIMLRGRGRMDFDATGLVAGDSLASFQFNIDEVGSTGGELHVLNVSSTGTGTAEINAIGTNPEVGVIHQHTGVFAAVAQGWKENGGFTDTTAAFDNPAVNVTVFDGDNDYIYIGSNAVFSQVRALLNTAATRSIFPVFEYSSIGPVWNVFNPTDGTDGFTQSGLIEFDSADLAGWAAVNVNGGNFFYIRIQRTRNNIGTIPIEELIRILEPQEYYWNEDGEILAANVTAAGLADTTQAQFAIGTYGAGGVLDGIGPLTNGQLVIGSTGLAPAAATLASAGGTVAITNGAGTINLEAAIGLAWTVVAVNAGLTVNTGTIANKAGLLTMTLPATAAIGDIIKITGINTAVGWRIAQNANQQIHMGLFSSAVGAGGFLEATQIRDSVELVCVVAGASTEYNVISSIGNITVT